MPEAKSPRKLLPWILGGVVVLVLALVGGPFAYIHFLSSEAPAPLSIASGPATGAAGGTTIPSAPLASLDGAWKVSTGSQAGYRVKEILLGQDAEAVGRTTAVTGQMTVSGTTVSAADFSVDLTKVTSDKSQRDGQFQNRIMETSKFPNATFKTTQPIVLGAALADGATVTAKATGDLTIHGVTKAVTIDVSAQRTGTAIKVSGNVPITFADYQIANPSGGPAKTEDTGSMEFLVVFNHA